MDTTAALRRLRALLNDAIEAAALTTASFGFPDDRVWVKRMQFGERGGISEGAELHPDAYIKAIVALHHQTWILGPLREALTILEGLAGPSIDAPEAYPGAHEDELRSLAAELRKASALRVLAPLGFVDNNDPEAPCTVCHRATGVVVDTATTKPDGVVAAVFERGKAKGQDEVKAAARRLFGVSPAES